MDFRDFRARMESAFGCDFGAVDFDVSASAEALTRSIGSVTAVRDQTIFLSKAFFAAPRARQERILAHEFAHVVQKRGRSNLCDHALSDLRWKYFLEIDAEQAATNALTRYHACCRVTDCPSLIRAWEQAGTTIPAFS